MYLELGDLAANALIETMRSKNERFVSYKTLEAYGEATAQVLRAKGKTVILLLSRERTAALYDAYPCLYREETVDGHKGVLLCEEKTEESLRRFRGYLPLDVLLAFVSPQAKAALGVN